MVLKTFLRAFITVFLQEKNGGLILQLKSNLYMMPKPVALTLIYCNYFKAKTISLLQRIKTHSFPKLSLKRKFPQFKGICVIFNAAPVAMIRFILVKSKLRTCTQI